VFHAQWEGRKKNEGRGRKEERKKERKDRNIVPLMTDPKSVPRNAINDNNMAAVITYRCDRY
jgi:hypothetical protein